jgi:hypothetical protein
MLCRKDPTRRAEFDAGIDAPTGRNFPVQVLRVSLSLQLTIAVAVADHTRAGKF